MNALGLIVALTVLWLNYRNSIKDQRPILDIRAQRWADKCVHANFTLRNNDAHTMSLDRLSLTNKNVSFAARMTHDKQTYRTIPDMDSLRTEIYPDLTAEPRKDGQMKVVIVTPDLSSYPKVMSFRAVCSSNRTNVFGKGKTWKIKKKVTVNMHK